MDIRDVDRAFTRKLGAERDDSGDHVYFYFEHDGSEYTVGKLSHSWRGSLNDTQIGMLAKKLLLRNREFTDFVSCRMDKATLIKKWLSRRP